MSKKKTCRMIHIVFKNMQTNIYYNHVFILIYIDSLYQYIHCRGTKPVRLEVCLKKDNFQLKEENVNILNSMYSDSNTMLRILFMLITL